MILPCHRFAHSCIKCPLATKHKNLITKQSKKSHSVRFVRRSACFADFKSLVELLLVFSVVHVLHIILSSILLHYNIIILLCNTVVELPI